MKTNHTKDEHSDIEGIVETIDENNVQGGDIHVGLHNATQDLLLAMTEEELRDARKQVFKEVRGILRTTLTSLQSQHEREKDEAVRKAREEDVNDFICALLH